MQRSVFGGGARRIFAPQNGRSSVALMIGGGDLRIHIWVLVLMWSVVEGLTALSVVVVWTMTGVEPTFFDGRKWRGAKFSKSQQT